MLDHSFWKLITDSGNPEKVIKKNQNGRSSKFRTGDQVKPEWVIKLGRNMHIEHYRDLRGLTCLKRLAQHRKFLFSIYFLVILDLVTFNICFFF